MTTITEDYVSFETAKLLKEKGFNELTTKAYPYFEGKDYKYDISCPTLQMAMKWMREVHNIFIEVSVSIDLNGKYHYSYSILNKEAKYVRKEYTSFDWDYNQACETAIKYSLENLI